MPQTQNLELVTLSWWICGGSFRYGHPLENPAFLSRHSFQLLTHPIWWTNTGITPVDKISTFHSNYLNSLSLNTSLNCKPWQEYLASQDQSWTLCIPLFFLIFPFVLVAWSNHYCFDIPLLFSSFDCLLIFSFSFAIISYCCHILCRFSILLVNFSLY